MKTLYFDCFAGASGDMILGATVAAGVDPNYLHEQLSLLRVDRFSITFETVNRSGLSATYARVETAHEHKHRHLSDIKQIIDASALSDAVKQRAVQIFTRLAEAEARVHNEPVEHVHFHEVGALDAIVDVVGAAICFDALKIERFVSSPVHASIRTFPTSCASCLARLKHTQLTSACGCSKQIWTTRRHRSSVTSWTACSNSARSTASSRP